MAMGNPKIDYFSLDVEGSELAILKTIPFDKLNINIMSVEVNHFPEAEKKEIKDLMDDNGYDLVKYISQQDFLFKKRVRSF